MIKADKHSVKIKGGRTEVLTDFAMIIHAFKVDLMMPEHVLKKVFAVALETDEYENEENEFDAVKFFEKWSM